VQAALLHATAIVRLSPSGEDSALSPRRRAHGDAAAVEGEDRFETRRLLFVAALEIILGRAWVANGLVLRRL
jgi:hypothetical protein